MTLYVVKNILKVHNRNHPKKREYVQGEVDMKSNKEKRKSNSKWMNNHSICEHNLTILGDNQQRLRLNVTDLDKESSTSKIILGSRTENSIYKGTF